MGELRYYIRSYIEGSTIHGFRYVIASKSLFAKITWIFIIVCTYINLLFGHRIVYVVLPARENYLTR